jgi:hypothetical protein
MATLTGLKLKAAIRRQNAWVADSWEARNDEYEAYRIQAHMERKAIAAARKAAEPKRDKTCQVCGAAILDNTGVIAHHGYTRPQGWHSQTSSCLGARYVAYQHSCDRLKEVAADLTRWVADTAGVRASLDSDPPAQITYQKRIPGSGYGRNERTEAITLDRPEGFSINDFKHSPGTYAYVLAVKKANLDSNLRHAAMDLAEMNRRIAAWKPIK